MVPPIVTVSAAASPRVSFPFNVVAPETVNPVKVPTDVKEEPTTALPNAVAVRVDTLLTLKTFPVAIFQS